MFANEVFKVCTFAEFSSSFTLFCLLVVHTLWWEYGFWLICSWKFIIWGSSQVWFLFDLSVTDFTCTKVLTQTACEQLDIDPTIDSLMRQAYGEPLLFSVGLLVFLHGIHAGLQLFIMMAIIPCPMVLLGNSMVFMLGYSCSSCWASLFFAQWFCWATVYCFA